MIVISFVFFLALFVLVGVLSVFKAKKTGEDYLLASSSVKPWLVALSAIATNNSGYMFVGQIGFTYEFGLQTIWIMIGWITGDFISSLFVHKKLRIQAEKGGALSFASVLSGWSGKDYKYLRIAGGMITLAFLGTYAGAQLNAGSKALHVLFDWDYSVGAIIGAVIVVLYCFAGGIRASIWTDAAQSFVMIVAMALMLFVALQELGGVSSFVSGLYNVSPDYMNLFPSDHPWGGFIGAVFFVMGWVFAGAGVIGQPHIMVRFMAMDNPNAMTRTRIYYYSWFTLFYAMTILIAFAARLLIPEVSNFDAELALPTLAGQLLPEALVGLVLAGLFAATMSTADSQVLSCTAALTNDLMPNKFKGYLIKKVATVIVVLVALCIALGGSESVFSLVLISWTALASAFGPLLIILVLNQKASQPLALCMMFTGMGSMMLWRYFDLGHITFEMVPGMIGGLAVFALAKTAGRLSFRYYS